MTDQNADYGVPQRSTCVHCGVDVLFTSWVDRHEWRHESLERVRYLPCDRDLWQAHWRLSKSYEELGGTWAEPAHIDGSGTP